jgi:outer membrane protein insertion porin family
MLQACNLPKLAKKEGPFLYKNKIEIIEKQEARVFGGNLDGYIKQRPNKSFLGIIRHTLRFYKMGSKHPNTLLGRFYQTKLGDAPVILDTSLIESTIKGMRGFLKTEGYYYPEINYAVTGKIHKKVVTYKISTGKAYHIYRIEEHIADKILDSIFGSQKDLSYVRLGNRISFENLLKEKVRINDQYRNNGYYSFNKEFVKFDFDTNVGDFRSVIGIQISNPENFQRFKTYKINSINIEIEPDKIDSNQFGRDSIHLTNFIYKPNSFPLNPEVLNRALIIGPNKLFSNENVNSTFGRLNELQLFKSVNMTAIPSNENTDTPSVNYQIKLQPSKKYDFTFEPQVITSDQSNLVSTTNGRNYGFASQITLANKNIFHNAEILQLSYRISVEAQRGATIPKRPFFNSFESNLTANLIFPKLLFLSKIDKSWTSSTNRSLITAAVIWEKNIDWIRNVYAVGFTWQKNRKLFNQYLVPCEISYIRTNFNSAELELQSANDPYLQSVFSNNLITASRYGFIYNNQSDIRKKHYTFVKWDVLELAGTFVNLAYKLFNIAPSDSGYNTFLGVQYFQYAKTFADLRYNRYLDDNNRLASRLAIGVAMPFGNSPNYVPFDKRFFTGGANSIRAFLPRSIGPGSYTDEGSLDRSGDIRLELNFEYRFNILNHFLEGALFTDMGNIWRIKDDGRKDAQFKWSSFYEQIALGTGVGIRLNLDFLILRLDASLPIFDPREPLGNRNVFYKYADLGLLWKNTIFNFGVGYPF